MGRTVILVLMLASLGAAAWWGFGRVRPRTEPAWPRFFVIGDNHGPRPVYRQLLEKAKAAGANFAVNVADFTEHGTTEELREVLDLEQEVGLTVYHVIGSHDLKADPSRKTWGREVGPAYQSLNALGSHFVFLDNADRSVGFPAAELEWLEQDLTANSAKTTFLFYHRPFGLPLEGLFGDDETPASRKTNERFKAIVRRFQPTAIFSGHVHTYLPYTLEGVSAFVTGGGGDPAQTLLGGASSSFFHGLLVTLEPDGPNVSVLRLDE